MKRSVPPCTFPRPRAPRGQLSLSLRVALCLLGLIAKIQATSIVVTFPADGETVPGRAPLEVSCVTSDLRSGSKYAIAVEVDEQGGGQFDIGGDGRYTFTLPPLGEGEHSVSVLLVEDGSETSFHGVEFFADSTASTETTREVLESSSEEAEAAQESSDAAEKANERHEPVRLEIGNPQQCATHLDRNLNLQVTVHIPPGQHYPNGRLVLLINGNTHPTPLESQNINVAEMPEGIHSMLVRAEDASSSEPLLAESGAVWFSVGAKHFNLEDAEQLTQHPHVSKPMAAQLFLCVALTSNSVTPRLWSLLSTVGRHEEALRYIRLALAANPGEAWFHHAHACSLWLNGHRAGLPYEEVVASFEAALERGLASVDAQAGINDMVGITDGLQETDEGLAMKSALLRAEMRHNRRRFGTALREYPSGHPCRGDRAEIGGPRVSEHNQCVIIFARQYLEELQDPWGPAQVAQGMGGANEAVIFISRQLRAQGYQVGVYGNPSAADSGRTDAHGVHWHPFWAYHEENRPAAFVVWWHHLDAVEIGHNAGAVHLWFHYRQYTQRYTRGFMERIAGAFAMSRYHAQQMPAFAEDKTIVSANGIDPAFFTDGPNHPRRFIYASHPFYGLKTLLRAWPEIHKRVPGSTLQVYYGWTPGMLRYIERIGEPARQFKEEVDRMLQWEGVVSKGMVGQQELTAALSECGFYLYPCEIAEISSISLMRAQAMGAIPITSRYPDSALNETAGRFDLGPPPRHGLIGNDEAWVAAWVDAIVHAALNDHELEAHRREMKAWARATFDWRRVSTQWDLIFRNGVHGAGSADIDKLVPVDMRSAPPHLEL